MKNQVFKIKIAGQAGQGIKSSGLILSKFLTRSGLNIYNYIEYPSLIRGGHNVMQINVSEDPVTGPYFETDFLIALNQESIHKHKSTLSQKSFVLYDSESKMRVDSLPLNITLLPVPLRKLAQESGGSDLLINVVSLGVVIGLMEGDVKVIHDLLSEEYGSNPEILKSDLIALDLGFDFAQKNFTNTNGNILKVLKHEKGEKKLVVDGDEAITLAAISSGLQFASIYPMTPITNILHNLARFQKDYNFIYMQPEDEIAAINLAIGASFAGARAMTATSGGGFCLMTEGFGLAGMTETPLVIIEGMRAGPATGLPTWSSQGDLMFVLHAHQDEFPRIVLAAGDANEAFYLTMEAFYLADKYQTPVVLLVDKNICEHEQSLPMFDISAYKIDRGKFENKFIENYKRYQISPDGISVRTIPGSGNFFISNSDEHDEFGYSNEEKENRLNQMNKRMQKLKTCEEKDMPKPIIYGPQNADLTIVSFGSNKGSILEAIKDYSNVNYLHLTWMNPFPAKELAQLLSQSKNLLLLECNFTSQLGALISQKTGIDILDKELKFDGRPFFVEDVRDIINKRVLKEKN